MWMKCIRTNQFGRIVSKSPACLGINWVENRFLKFSLNTGNKQGTKANTGHICAGAKCEVETGGRGRRGLCTWVWASAAGGRRRREERRVDHLVQMQVARQHRAHVAGEAQRVQEGQQVEQRRVGRVAEPRLDRDGVVWKHGTSQAARKRLHPHASHTWKLTVGAGRVVQNQDWTEIHADGRQVFRVAAVVERAVLTHAHTSDQA